MSSILTNNGAMVALQTLTSINKDLGQVRDQISTGLKIATAKDNAATWAVANSINSDIDGFKQVSDNLSVANSTVAVARSGAEQVTSLLNDMKTKIIEAQSAATDADRSVIQNDIVQLRDQIGSVVDSAQFGGVNLLKTGGTMSTVSSITRDATGAASASTITATAQSLETTAGTLIAGALTGDLGGDNTAGDNVSFTTADAETIAIEVTDGDAAGNVFTFTVGDQTVSYEYGGDDDELADIATGIGEAIENLGISGVSVDVDAEVIQITNNTGDNLTITAEARTGAAGGLSDLAAMDVSTLAGANTAFDNIDAMITTAEAAASTFGSIQGRLENQTEFVTKLVDNLTAGVGSMVDTNMEEASAKLQALQVQQQLGTQSLSIANQAPQSILSLFR